MHCNKKDAFDSRNEVHKKCVGSSDVPAFAGASSQNVRNNGHDERLTLQSNFWDLEHYF